MTLYPPLWAGGGSYTDDADRQFVTQMFPAEGVLDFATSFKVSQRGAGANMSVDVAAGGAIVQGDHVAGQGRYLCSSDAVTNVAINAAPGAGLSRIDRIVLVAHDAEAVGSGTTATRIDYVVGTAAASPSAPAIPSSALPLARVTVPNGKVSIVNADITDDRVPAQVINRTPVIADFDTPGQTIANTANADLTLSSPTVRPSSYAASLFFNAGTPTRMLVPWTGLYDAYAEIGISANGAFGWTLNLYQDGGTERNGTWPHGGATSIAGAALGIYLTAGQYLRWNVENLTGASRTVDAAVLGHPRLIYRGAV